MNNKSYRILGLFLLIVSSITFINCGGGGSLETVSNISTDQNISIEDVALTKTQVTNDIMLYADKKYEELVPSNDEDTLQNLAPRKSDGKYLYDYMFIVDEKYSGLAENDSSSITYDFIFYFLDGKTGDIVYDISGDITYKFVWSGGKWVPKESTTLDPNPKVNTVKNNITVTGTVMAGVIVQPIANAQIFFTSANHGNRPVQTNDQGKFSAILFNDPTSVFYYTVTAPGFESLAGTIEIASTKLNFGTVTLFPDVSENYADYPIEGYVKDSTGTTGIEGAQVFLRDINTGEPVAHTGSALTDATGYFELKNVPRDWYKEFILYAIKPGVGEAVCEYPTYAGGYEIIYLNAETTLDITNTSSTSIALAWDAAKNLDGTSFSGNYYIYAGDTLIGNVSAATLTYNFNPVTLGLSSDKTHFIKVIAKDFSGNIVGKPQTGFVQPIKGQSSWTVMIYAMGDNNLSAYGTGYTYGTYYSMGDINELEQIPDNAQINYLFEMDTYGYEGSKRYKIQYDGDSAEVTSPIIANFDELNSVDVNHAQSFFEWGIEKYPADHYVVMLWNHGGGWRGGESITESPLASPRRSIGEDVYHPGETITNSQVGTMMAALKAKAGKNMDILMYDACIMQCAETVYEVAPSVDFQIASQQNMYGDSWNMKDIFTYLSANPTATAVAVSSNIVSAQCDTLVRTVSSVSTTGLTNAMGVISSFASSMASWLADPATQADAKTCINWAWYYTSKFNNDDANRDLFEFCQNVIDQGASTAVETAAQAVIDAKASIVIQNAVETSTDPNATGLSIYMPNPTTYDWFWVGDTPRVNPADGVTTYTWSGAVYSGTAFAQASTWDNFMDAWFDANHPGWDIASWVPTP